MTLVYFVGIDLAWSKRNDTGLCILSLQNDVLTVESYTLLTELDDIVSIVTQTVQNRPCIIGIDAPLTVKNNDGRRNAEHELQKHFYKSHAVAHPANRNRLGQWNQGVPRGEELVTMLESFGFEENPSITNKYTVRQMMEVFPHPAQVELFELKKILPYKQKPGRDYESRITTFKSYQNYLKGLHIDGTEKFLTLDLTTLKGVRLKEYEDILDALFCAYIVYAIWKNPQQAKIFGSKEDGHIIVPMKRSLHH